MNCKPKCSQLYYNKIYHKKHYKIAWSLFLSMHLSVVRVESCSRRGRPVSDRKTFLINQKIGKKTKKEVIKHPSTRSSRRSTRRRRREGHSTERRGTWKKLQHERHSALVTLTQEKTNSSRTEMTRGAAQAELQETPFKIWYHNFYSR